MNNETWCGETCLPQAAFVHMYTQLVAPPDALLSVHHVQKTQFDLTHNAQHSAGRIHRHPCQIWVAKLHFIAEASFHREISYTM